MKARARNLLRGLFEVVNDFMFTPLDGVLLRWTLTEGSSVLRTEPLQGTGGVQQMNAQMTRIC